MGSGVFFGDRRLLIASRCPKKAPDPCLSNTIAQYWAYATNS